MLVIPKLQSSTDSVAEFEYQKSFPKTESQQNVLRVQVQGLVTKTNPASSYYFNQTQVIVQTVPVNIKYLFTHSTQHYWSIHMEYLIIFFLLLLSKKKKMQQVFQVQ